MSFSRFYAVIKKEFLHIINDPRTLIILIAMPTLQLILFGYAMNMETKDIKLTVFDYSSSVQSRELIAKFIASPYFKVKVVNAPLNQIESLFKSRFADAVLIFPKDYATVSSGSNHNTLELIIDTSDPNAGQLIRNYITALINLETSRKISLVDIRPRLMFNPELKSSYFFVPGLIAMILIMICALLTSISITKEKELGTMEQILVSPARKPEILLGKVIPYVILSLIDASLILGIGMTVFGVPFNGSIMTFILATFTYVMVALSLGMLISTIAKSQQAAMMMALTMTLLPTMLLSGFVFPISSMPKLLQYLTYIVPAKYYLVIIRNIMIKGSNLSEILYPILVLSGMSLLLLVFSLLRFKTTLTTK